MNKISRVKMSGFSIVRKGLPLMFSVVELTLNCRARLTAEPRDHLDPSAMCDKDILEEILSKSKRLWSTYLYISMCRV